MSLKHSTWRRSEQHCSQWPGGGGKPSGHQGVNGYIKCGLCIQWAITQPFKKKGILVHAPTWVNLENIALSEKSQLQTATRSVTPRL